MMTRCAKCAEYQRQIVSLELALGSSVPNAGALPREILKTLPGEDPTQKSARLRKLQRQARDRTLAYGMAAIIKLGKTTETARQTLQIGSVRAQRVRSIAVKMGLLRAHQRGAL